MLPPISFFVSCKYLPLKVQAGIVTNKGTEDIYLFGIEDDIPITSLSQLQAFSFCILGPGQSVDIEANPHIGWIKSTDKDKCITIHSMFDIDVDIESNDLPTSWMGDSSHPWNGGVLPNGGYTDKFKLVTVNTTAPSTITLPKPSPGQIIHISVREPIEFIPLTITIDTSPKCTCGEKSSRHPGRCSSWCDLELAKDKNV